MARDYDYARQKFWEAVNALVSDDSIQLRLGYAQNYLLSLQAEKDIPSELRERFVLLMKELNRRVEHFKHRPTRIRCRAPQSVEMAKEIFALYTEIRGGI